MRSYGGRCKAIAGWLGLAGLLLARTGWRSEVQLSTLGSFAVVYGWAVWWLFAEAMQGSPLLR